MISTIYTFGYSGRQLSELEEHCDRVNGYVVDVRLSPRSRNHLDAQTATRGAGRPLRVASRVRQYQLPDRRPYRPC